MPDKTKPDPTRYITLAIIFAFALAFRIIGITWSLPNELHHFTYHPDELLLISSAVGMLSPFSLNPRFYNYGTLYIYLIFCAAVAALGRSTGAEEMLQQTYIGARLISAVLGAAVIFTVYSIGKRLAGRFTGLIAAICLAIAPLHIMHSHFATVDSTAVFFSALAVLYGLICAADGKLKQCFYAGLFAGFAAGTKYNAGLMLVPAVVGVLLGVPARSAKAVGSRAGLCALGAVLGFLIGTPGVLLFADDFLKGLRFEITHSATGHGFVFANTDPGWLWHIRSSLLYGLGPALLGLAILGFIYATARALRKEKAPIVLLSGLIPYYIIASTSEVRFARYLLPVFPILTVLAAYAITSIYKHFSEKSRWAAVLWFTFSGTALIITFAYSVEITRLFIGEDPRDRAYLWLKDNAVKGETIAFATIPWFYSPPVTPQTTALDPAQRYNSLTHSKDRWELLANPEMEFDKSILNSHPRYVIVSDYELNDRIRADDPAAAAFMSELKARYKLAVKFERHSPLFDTEKLPHDMKYTAPTIIIYERR